MSLSAEDIQQIRNRGFCASEVEWFQLCDMALEAAGKDDLTHRLVERGREEVDKNKQDT